MFFVLLELAQCLELCQEFGLNHCLRIFQRQRSTLSSVSGTHSPSKKFSPINPRFLHACCGESYMQTPNGCTEEYDLVDIDTNTSPSLTQTETWEYQWYACCGLSILPNGNLIPHLKPGKLWGPYTPQWKWDWAYMPNWLVDIDLKWGPISNRIAKKLYE